MAWSGDSPNRLRGRPWRRLRAQVLSEEPFCRLCTERGAITIASRSIVCDHITALADGGTNDRSNLQGLCGACHDEKTAEEAARAQGRAAPAQVRRTQVIGADGWPVEG